MPNTSLCDRQGQRAHLTVSLRCVHLYQVLGRQNRQKENENKSTNSTQLQAWSSSSCTSLLQSNLRPIVCAGDRGKRKRGHSLQVTTGRELNVPKCPQRKQMLDSWNAGVTQLRWGTGQEDGNISQFAINVSKDHQKAFIYVSVISFVSSVVLNREASGACNKADVCCVT